jgi:hypothetical protein
MTHEMKRLTWTLWFTLIVFNVFDVWTTTEVFARGGYEANPLLSNNVTVMVLLKLTVLAIIFVLLRRNENKAWVPYGLMATVLIYAIAVGSNIGTLYAL